jgi:hypothetical protein
MSGEAEKPAPKPPASKEGETKPVDQKVQEDAAKERERSGGYD